MPGLVLALVLLPLARPLRSDEGHAKWTLGFLAALYALTVLSTPQWFPRYIVGTVLLTAALVWVPASLGYLRGIGRVTRVRAAAAVAGVVILAIALGRAQEVQYDEHHYSEPTLFLQEGGPVKAFHFIRKQHDQRIGIAGGGEIFFDQYGFYGTDLSNKVRYIGVPGPHGQYTLATNCRRFRKEVNAGDYDYLVTSQYAYDNLDSEYAYAYRAWTKDDPALKEVVAENVVPQPDYVYKVVGELDPARCGANRDTGGNASS
jgi:hypothetical protein